MGIILGYNQKFICPQCGCSYFGSSELQDGTLMRECHGVGCDYHWHESKDEDHIYEKFPQEQNTIPNWIKRNKGILVAGLVPGVIAGGVAVTIYYSIWVTLAMLIIPFVVTNGFILLVEAYQKKN